MAWPDEHPNFAGLNHEVNGLSEPLSCVKGKIKKYGHPPWGILPSQNLPGPLLYPITIGNVKGPEVIHFPGKVTHYSKVTGLTSPFHTLT